jgi:hypothetical protein
MVTRVHAPRQVEAVVAAEQASEVVARRQLEAQAEGVAKYEAAAARLDAAAAAADDRVAELEARYAECSEGIEAAVRREETEARLREQAERRSAEVAAKLAAVKAALSAARASIAGDSGDSDDDMAQLEMLDIPDDTASPRPAAATEFDHEVAVRVAAIEAETARRVAAITAEAAAAARETEAAEAQAAESRAEAVATEVTRAEVGAAMALQEEEGDYSADMALLDMLDIPDDTPTPRPAPDSVHHDPAAANEPDYSVVYEPAPRGGGPRAAAVLALHRQEEAEVHGGGPASPGRWLAPTPPAAQAAGGVEVEVRRLYAAHAPEKLGDVPALVGKYGEDRLLAMVRKKYGVAEVQRLYGKHNPEKLADVPGLVEKYGADKLLAMVTKKYLGQASSRPSPPTESPPTDCTHCGRRIASGIVKSKRTGKEFCSMDCAQQWATRARAQRPLAVDATVSPSSMQAQLQVRAAAALPRRSRRACRADPLCRPLCRPHSCGARHGCVAPLPADQNNKMDKTNGKIGDAAEAEARLQEMTALSLALGGSNASEASAAGVAIDAHVLAQAQRKVRAPLPAVQNPR